MHKYPADFVITYLKAIDAQAFKLVHYEVMTASDLETAKEEKGSDVDLSVVDEIWISLNDDKMVNEILLGVIEIDDPNTEVGFSNEFRDKDGIVRYLLYADCDTPDWREVAYDFPGWSIAKTDKGHHAYTKQHVDNMEEFCKALENKKSVDPKWLLLSNRLKGFAVLRITNNCKNVRPYFIK